MALEDEEIVQRYGFIDSLDREIVPEVAISILNFVKENDLYETLIDEVSTFEYYWSLVTDYYSTDKTYADLAEESGQFTPTQMEFNINRTMSVIVQTISAIDTLDKTQVERLKEKIGASNSNGKIFTKIERHLKERGELSENNFGKKPLRVITTEERMGMVSRHPELIMQAIQRADIEQKEKEIVYQILGELRADLEDILTFGGVFSETLGLATSLKGYENFVFLPNSQNNWTITHKKSGVVVKRYGRGSYQAGEELEFSSEDFRAIFDSEGLSSLLNVAEIHRSNVRINYVGGGGLEEKLRTYIVREYQSYNEGELYKGKNLAFFIEKLREDIKKEYKNINVSLKEALKEKYTYSLGINRFELRAEGGQNVLGSYAIHCYWDYRDELASSLIKEIIEG